MGSHIVSMCDYKVGNVEDIISTHFLGSCISIVLYDKKSKIGGLSHSLLPSFINDDDADSSAKYVDKIIPLIISEMKALGSSPYCIQAMIFGGSRMDSLKNFDLRIGQNNISKSKEILNSFNIPIIFEDTGGKQARSITFNCSNGEVILKKAFSNEIIEASFRQKK